jgi:hypothetical protein
MRFPCGVLRASTLAALLGTTVTVIDGCVPADCNDTATCPVVGDETIVSDARGVEASDEAPGMSDGFADASDGDPNTGDAAADRNDGTVALSDSPADIRAADASEATVVDAVVLNPTPDGPPVDVGVDGAVDVGVDAPMEAPSPKCVSNLLVPTAAVSLSVNGGNVAASAIDNNFATRWESAQGIDPEWIYLDFGSPVFFDRVRILWEASCAKNYDLQASNDAVTWRTMKSIVGNTLMNWPPGPTDWSAAVDSTGFTGVGRYLRVFGTVRCHVYGYSMWEMQAYGDTNASCAP